MLTMEFDKDFDAVILQALLEVERDLSLPTNSVINTLPHDTIPPPLEKNKSLSVCLDQNLMEDVFDELIRHSRELIRCKRIAVQERTIPHDTIPPRRGLHSPSTSHGRPGSSPSPNHARVIGRTRN